MLRKIDRNLWVAEQPLKYWGLEVGTRMTVIRLETGKLAIISPIQVNAETLEQIDSLGEVTFIIAPNLYHHLFVANFKKIYPQAELWGVPGLDVKRPDLPIDKILDTREKSPWTELDYLFLDGFQVLGPKGASTLNEFVFFHRETQTLILTDAAFHFDRSFPILTRRVTQVLGGYNQLSPSRLEKWASPQKEKIARSLEKILHWNFDRVIMAHGSIIENQGKQKLKAGYEWFLQTTL